MPSLVKRLLRSDVSDDGLAAAVATAQNGATTHGLVSDERTPSIAVTAIPTDRNLAAVDRAESLSDLKPHLMDFLYNNPNPIFAKCLDVIEQKLSIAREKLFAGVLLLGVVYLVVGSGAQLLCNLIGFGYPAYASVLAIRSADKADDTYWLIYWVVFATFSLLDFYAETIMVVMPLYWVAKALILLYLALPQTSGANMIYWSYVDPFVTKLENSARKWAAVGK